MFSKIICLLAVCLLASCQHHKNKVAEKKLSVNVPAPKPGLTLADLKSKFKYHDLKIFDLDSVSWDDLDRKFMRVDSVAFKLIFQEGDRKFMSEGYDQDYYYSWQNRNSNLTEITMITVDETNSCLLLKYYVFNKVGKLVSKFDIASRCGDGGWVLTAQGRQLNLSTFNYDMVESESDLSDNTEEGDSTRTEISIKSSGKITEKEVYKKHFTRKDN